MGTLEEDLEQKLAMKHNIFKFPGQARPKRGCAYYGYSKDSSEERSKNTIYKFLQQKHFSQTTEAKYYSTLEKKHGFITQSTVMLLGNMTQACRA